MATPGDPQPAALPPEARLPAPVASGSQQPGASSTPGLSGTPSASETPSASATPGASPSGSEESVAAGPVPGMAVPVSLAFSTDLLGEVSLQRTMMLGQGASTWQVRWSPAAEERLEAGSEVLVACGRPSWERLRALTSA